MTKERAVELCHAIDQYLCAGNPIWDTEAIHEAMDMAVEALKAEQDTESAYAHGYTDAEARFHSERKTGRWKQCGKEIECDRCGAIYPDYIHPICGRHNYCPNCGADMRGEQE